MKKRIMYGSELIGEFPWEFDLNKDISSIVNPPIYISIHPNAKKPIFGFQQHDLLGKVGDRRYCYYYDSIYYLFFKHIEGHIEISGDCVNLFFYGNPPTSDVIWSIIDPFVFSIIFQLRGSLFLHGGAIIFFCQIRSIIRKTLSGQLGRERVLSKTVTYTWFDIVPR